MVTQRGLLYPVLHSVYSFTELKSKSLITLFSNLLTACFSNQNVIRMSETHIYKYIPQIWNSAWLKVDIC